MTEAVAVVVLEGVFYAQGSDLWVEDEAEGAVNVWERLKTLEGKNCHLAIHHKPPDPPQRDRWGGGACLFEPTGECPLGHREHKGWLYTFHNTGIIADRAGNRHLLDRWRLLVDGDAEVDPGFRFLEGHRSQVVATCLPSIEQLKGSIGEEFDLQNLEDLSGRLSNLQTLLSQVQDLKDKL